MVFPVEVMRYDENSNVVKHLLGQSGMCDMLHCIRGPNATSAQATAVADISNDYCLQCMQDLFKVTNNGTSFLQWNILLTLKLHWSIALLRIILPQVNLKRHSDLLVAYIEIYHSTNLLPVKYQKDVPVSTTTVIPSSQCPSSNYGIVKDIIQACMTKTNDSYWWVNDKNLNDCTPT